MHEKSRANLNRGVTPYVSTVGVHAGFQGCCHCAVGCASQHPELESCHRPKKGSWLKKTVRKTMKGKGKKKKPQKKVRGRTGEGMRWSGYVGVQGILESAGRLGGEGAWTWKQLWGSPGYLEVGRSCPLPGCREPGLAQPAGSKQDLLRLEQLSCAVKARRAIWRGQCWQGPVLQFPCNRCHLVQHDPPCVSPVQDPAPAKPACPPPFLHPLQRGCTALHSGGFQGMMCTTQGVQLVRRGVGGVLFKRAWLGAVSSAPRSCPACLPQLFCC